MPYLLLAIGLIIGLYALYRFFINANLHQIKSLFLSALLLTLCIALFFMAVTGRLAYALGLVAALIPVLVSSFKAWKEDGTTEASKKASQEISTRKDALEVLGLSDDASEDEIKKAYKKLMQKVHPDAEGSEWMAAKLNQARDLLINKNDE